MTTDKDKLRREQAEAVERMKEVKEDLQKLKNTLEGKDKWQTIQKKTKTYAHCST